MVWGPNMRASKKDNSHLPFPLTTSWFETAQNLISVTPDVDHPNTYVVFLILDGTAHIEPPAGNRSGPIRVIAASAGTDVLSWIQDDKDHRDLLRKLKRTKLLALFRK